MSNVLYNDYKVNYHEYMKTVLYTEKILNDNNSDQNKLLHIYEKAIKSAESMFKRMQLEVETNNMMEQKQEEFTEMQNEIMECKKKLKKLKEEIMIKEHRNRNIENNTHEDRVYLLRDPDLLEKGDVYISQSKILMDNSEYMGKDVMNNLHKQKENIKKNLSNISFVSNNLDNAKKIMKNLNHKELLNKYRLYIIFLFIALTFIFIGVVKYNRYVRQNVLSDYENPHDPNINNTILNIAKAEDSEHVRPYPSIITTSEPLYIKSVDRNNIDQHHTANSVIYDFVESSTHGGSEEGDQTIHSNSHEENVTEENKTVRSENGNDQTSFIEEKVEEQNQTGTTTTTTAVSVENNSKNNEIRAK